MGVTTIYALSTGSYSGYTVEFLFRTQAAAEKYAAGMKNDPERRVEEFLLLDSEETPIYDTLYVIRHQGATKGTLQPNGAWDSTSLRTPGSKAPSRRPEVKLYLAGHLWQLVVSGPDKQAVQQAASDRVAQLAAEEQGIA